MSGKSQQHRSDDARAAPVTRGFTLVELVISMAILVILTAIALPAYQSYVYRANRAVAKSALVSAANQQETYFIERKQYATSLYLIKIPSSSATITTLAYLYRDGSMSSSSTNTTTKDVAIYQLGLGTGTTCPTTVSSAGAVSSYLLMAVPIGPQVKDTGCGTMCLTSSGQRLVSGVSTTCWTR